MHESDLVPVLRAVQANAGECGRSMIAKILRGSKAGDIPMEQPTTYELAINAATAKKLGIRIPESIRIRVDRVIDH